MNHFSEVATSYDHKEFNKVKPYDHKVVVRKESQADLIVDKLIRTFNNEEYRPLFRKAGWYLSESVIENAIELSQKARTTPIAYFVFLIKKELHK